MAEWTALDTYNGICFVFRLPNSHSEAFNCIIPNFKECKVKTVPSYATFALPIPPEQPTVLHASTPVMGLILQCLTNPNDIIAPGAEKCFQFILFISCTMCVGVQTFQILS